MEAKANVIEGNTSRSKFSHNQKKGKDNAKRALTAPKAVMFKKKIQGACWVCGNPGHKSMDCRHKKDKPAENKNQANMAEDQFIAVVSEVNLMTNSNDWWIDTGASRHVCAKRSMFTTDVQRSGGENLYMGNCSSTAIEGK